MPQLPPTFRPATQRDKRERDREHDARRGSARQRGYDTRWDKARRTYLMAHPLCVMCEREGRVTAAAVVDHIVPHRGDQRLFWNTGNWQSLCVSCHSRHKQRQESGSVGVISGDGRPLR